MIGLAILTGVLGLCGAAIGIGIIWMIVYGVSHIYLDIIDRNEEGILTDVGMVVGGIFLIGIILFVFGI